MITNKFIRRFSLEIAALALLLSAGMPAFSKTVTPEEKHDTIRVRVMTYNLRYGEFASLEEIAMHIKSFKPDFVALQELDCKTARTFAVHQNGKDFISELAYRSGMFGLYGKTINFAGGLYGIGILSKYPYISMNKTMLPNPAKTEQRALLEGVFEVGNDTLIFASTHLDYKYDSSRIEQGKLICDHFKDAPYPVILGGDFNAESDSRLIVELMNKTWFSATNSDLSYPADNPEIKIDYIFTRPMKGWRVVKTQTVHSQLSDHLPIVTDLEYIR